MDGTPMRTTPRNAQRLVADAPTRRWRRTALAYTATALVYLTWRVTSTLSGASPFPAALLAIVDVWGVLLVAGWLWRSRPHATFLDSAPRAEQFDVVITAGAARGDALERTLIALQSVRGVGDVVVIGRAITPETAALCATYRVHHRGDGGSTAPASFLHAFCSTTTPAVLWLDAGQVPRPDVLEVATAWTASDDRLGVLQLGERMLSPQSYAGMSRAGDEWSADQRCALPALGGRRIAPWIGPGSVVRRDALQRVTPPADADPCALERVASRLQAAGWHTAHDGRELVGSMMPDTLSGDCQDFCVRA